MDSRAKGWTGYDEEVNLPRNQRPHRLAVRTPAFHAGNTGSIPVGVSSTRSTTRPLGHASPRTYADAMINGAVSEAFNRIADLLEITGEKPFRVNSYKRVARLLKSHTEDVADIAAGDRLTELPGVGTSTADKIKEFIETGTISLLEELRNTLPEGLPDLLRIQGLGPKKVAVVHHQLGVGSIDDLKRVIESGQLAALPGFGTQSVKRISEGIAFQERSGGRTPYGAGLHIAEAMAEWLHTLPGVQRVEIAGSLRRGAETIGDIDLLCECDLGERIVKAFVSHGAVKRVLADGSTKGSVTVDSVQGREIQIDLRVVPGESFGAALQYFTGSKEHNVRLRELAIKKKLRLNEYGLYQNEDRIAGETEESIYESLGLPPIPAELREDRGEFDAKPLPDLITVADIRGDLHLHTIASDGKCTIEEMALAAQKRGYEYLAVTDHSRSSTIANGLSIDRMIAHIEAIREVDRRMPQIRVLVGCECDILLDGSLDYPDDILAQCDLVVASIHAGMTSTKTTPTKRLRAAIDNPYVTIIGHTTGRLLLRRPAMEIDMADVTRAAAANGTVMEINSAWQRLDLKDIHARQAVDAGVMLAINTDSHHTDGFSQVRYGVTTARRGWVSRDHVLNTKPIGELLAWIGRKRAS
jgi:DNA polymerase (family X)